jgi:hypothetical protein
MHACERCPFQRDACGSCRVHAPDSEPTTSNAADGLCQISLSASCAILLSISSPHHRVTSTKTANRFRSKHRGRARASLPRDDETVAARDGDARGEMTICMRVVVVWPASVVPVRITMGQMLAHSNSHRGPVSLSTISAPQEKKLK